MPGKNSSTAFLLIVFAMTSLTLRLPSSLRLNQEER